MRAVFKKIPMLEEILYSGETASQMLSNENHFEKICDFFNWFLFKIENRYKENPIK